MPCQCILRYRIPHDRYEQLIGVLLNGERLPAPNLGLEKYINA